MEEETLKHLWESAAALSSESHAGKLLKSYYLTTFRKIAKNRLQLPPQNFSKTQMCSRCSSIWSQSDFELKLRPQCLVNNLKTQKLIAKLEESKSTLKNGLLSNKQKRRAKWLKKRVSSKIEIQCEMCKQTTFVPLEKPKKQKDTTRVPTESLQVLATKPLKKKRRKKDKTAGLKIANITEKTKKKVIQAMPNETQLLKKKPTVITANNPCITQPVKTKKNGKQKLTLHTSLTAKTQSKTQQNRSLLQLAELLRSDGVQKQNTNTAQNRLESLLK